MEGSKKVGTEYRLSSGGHFICGFIRSGETFESGYAKKRNNQESGVQNKRVD